MRQRIEIKQWDEFIQDYLALSKLGCDLRLSSKIKKIIDVPVHDKRFFSHSWDNDPYFIFLQQAYLLYCKHAKKMLEAHYSQDPTQNKEITFFTKMILEALSPTNYPFTNPEVIAETIKTNGQNFYQGAKNFLEDLQRGAGMWQLKTADKKAFEVGKNLATSPGNVVFQNELFQLIQYTPKTAKNYERPILIIPPCINKYYILDLSPKNSFVKCLVEKNLSVFMVSWINPDKNLSETSLEDYILKGVCTAIDTVKKITEQQSINALGFCIGGTLLASTLAYYKARNNPSIHTATFLTTLIDFKEVGDIAVFVNKEQLSNLEKQMAKTGYLNGNWLQSVFTALKSNDLVWPFYINNYLYGKNPEAFDILYWNSDPCNLPKRMATELIRDLYLDNKLCRAKSFTIKGIELDLSTVTAPCYFFSAEQDHIAPWKSTYQGAEYLSSKVTFVLGGAGHIAGVINPPSQKKYYYRTHPHPTAGLSAQQWYEEAQEQAGSWWEHWIAWIKPYSGKQCSAYLPGGGRLPILEPAPGSYVKNSIF